MQQLPRDDKSIKMMLCAGPGNVLVGSDYSGQEMRMAAHASDDPDMIGAYAAGKDLYSIVACAMFNNKYEDNLEFYPAGTKINFEGQEITTGDHTHLNKAGKLRRQSAKSVLIGSVYGRGAASIAEQINEKRKPEDRITKEDAQEIMDKFYAGFPRITQWMNEMKESAHKKGYVENWNGRRRRLPDAQLPKYSIKQKQNDGDFNPLLGCGNRVDTEKIEKYRKILEKVTWQKDYERVKKEALAEGIEIHNNNGMIAQAERQSINFPCQSGGAELTKLAMIAIDSDEELNNLGFGLLLTIHDEVLGECPKENAEKVANRLTTIMVDTAKKYGIKVPMKCDPAITDHWLLDEMEGVINDEYNKYTEKYGDSKKALKEVELEHPELLPENIEATLLQGKPLVA